MQRLKRINQKRNLKKVKLQSNSQNKRVSNLKTQIQKAMYTCTPI